MYNTNINKPSGECTTFLGIKFNRLLNFNEQIDSIKSKCNDRMNILKILSHRSWGLNKNILKKLYCSLIRSLIEYSSFTFNNLSNTNKQKLQAIQNISLRIIFNKKFDHSARELHINSNLKTIEERANILLLKYITKAEINKNELIGDLLQEFKSFKNTFNNRERELTILDFCII